MNDLFSLKGKTAIITGSGRGIGRAIAIGMAGAGANVVLISRTKSQLEEVEKVIKETSTVETLAITADVTSKSEIENVVEKTLQKFGRIDILVNNAGINFKKNFLDITEEDWNRIINTNLNGEFLFASIVSKQMAKQKYGRIINTASVGAHLGLSNTSPYCASKGAILQLTKVMAIDLAPYNITVNALSPGFIDTGLLTDPVVKQKIIETVEKSTVLKRPGTPEEMVGAAIFLASDAASYVTGISLLVDGGMTCFAI